MSLTIHFEFNISYLKNIYTFEYGAIKKIWQIIVRKAPQKKEG